MTDSMAAGGPTGRAAADEADALDAAEQLRYRVLTGPDDAEFCRRVSAALDRGYVLHGSPAITTRHGEVLVAQAVVRPAEDAS